MSRSTGFLIAARSTTLGHAAARRAHGGDGGCGDDDHDDAAQSPPWTFAIKVYEAKRGMRKHLVHEMQTNFN